MIREYDPRSVNDLVNHDLVRPWVSPYGEIDLTSIVEDHNNIVYMDETGGLLAYYLSPGEYEIHTFFIIQGRDVFRKVRQALDYLFTHGAERLISMVPLSNPRALGLVRIIHGSFYKEEDHIIFGPSKWFELTKSRWEEKKCL